MVKTATVLYVGGVKQEITYERIVKLRDEIVFISNLKRTRVSKSKVLSIEEDRH